MKDIKNVLEKVYNNKELRRNIVPLFLSNPGMGKSNIIEDFMREKGVWIPPFVLSQRMPFEISGMALVDKELDKMKYYDFDFIMDLKDGSILFIDEVTNSNPITLNAFLTFIESRVTISGKKLPDIMIVAAGNPQGMTPMTPQIKERFVWYTLNFDAAMWSEYMKEKFSIPPVILNKLIPLIQAETFKLDNFNTPRSFDKQINMMIKGVPTPYAKLLGPILNTKIKNPLDKKVKLSKDFTLEADGEIAWLDLIKYKLNK